MTTDLAVPATDIETFAGLAILDLMLYGGLRRSEVSELDARSLRQDQGRWWIVFRRLTHDDEFRQQRQEYGVDE